MVTDTYPPPPYSPPPTDLTQLTRRELFAALIAAGLATNRHLSLTDPHREDYRTAVCRTAVDLADELIRELEQ